MCCPWCWRRCPTPAAPWWRTPMRGMWWPLWTGCRGGRRGDHGGGPLRPDGAGRAGRRAGHLSGSHHHRRRAPGLSGHSEGAARRPPDLARRGRYTLREMEFAQTCRETVAAGEAAVQRALAPLEPVRALREGAELVHTLQLYLLDTDRSVTQTAQALFVHKNTPSNTGFSSSAQAGAPGGQVPGGLQALYRLRGGAPAGGLRLAGRAVSLSQGTMRQPCFSAWKPITFLL